MEFHSERSSHGHGSSDDDDDDDEIIIKDEKRSYDESSVGGDDDQEDEDHRPKQEASIEEPPPPMTTTEKSVLQAVPIRASSTKMEEDDELENAKAEMGEVIEENQRLKLCLNRVLNEYRTLQVQFHSIVQQDHQTKSPPNNNNNKEHDDDDGIDNNNSHQEMLLLEESELVSLSLGRLPNNNQRMRNEKVKEPKALKLEGECKEGEEGLELGLECKFETSKSESITTEHNLGSNSNARNNSCELLGGKEGEGGEVKSSTRSREREGGGEDEVSQQNNTAKKARVCVRARCDTPTMNDGCQWRKYGQKISKGNPCPRAYYRCTVAPSCPVRKQVQRCAQDMSILITTYEGTHNHPLPLSATAMASTTSAAASMLLSASSSSASHHSSSIPSSLSTTTPHPPNPNLLHHHHPMNLFLSSDSSKSRQFYLSHPSSLSSSSSHPTITLDLTTTSSNPSSSSSSSAPFARFNTNFNNKYPSSTSLNFSTNNPLESNAISWTNNNGFFTNNNRNNILSTMNLGRSQPIESLYHSFNPRNNSSNNNNVPFSSSHQNSLPDTIAAATKVITADPNFQSALAAALTSIISTQGNNQQGGVGENLGQKMKWGEIFQAANNNNNNISSSALPSTSKANNIGCASSFLNKAAPANNNNNTQTTGNNNLVFLPSPSLPYSGTKSASGSPADNRDNTN